MATPGDMTARLLSLLYAGPGSAVCRLDGHLVVRGAGLHEGEVLLTQEEFLDRGLAALFELIA
ncbi:hypothetical protein [Nocardiopsis synnemataformans]|uniref:hypothetical protein n=1 Tax=Nocardiopsis synnemataformans TaxID=61305 RepID=UPI003EBCC7F4